MFSKKDKGKKPQYDITLYDLPNDSVPESAAIKGTEVAIFRPPVMLDPTGHTMPGVSKDLVARYLVATTAALAEADLGPVTVEWKAQEGRFCETAFTIQTWGQTIEVIHPIAPVSQKLANAWEIYKAGVALKVRELHKGHQRFGEANALIKRASRDMEGLRDDSTPHFSDAEYLFLQAGIHKAMVLSALPPVGKTGPEQVVGGTANVG